MYTNYFGFREKPFNVTPDPRFVYMNPAFREAYASVLAGIRERKGFVALTGEVGTGKTTLLRVLMKNLEATVRFVYFYNTTLSFEELLTYGCEELGLDTGGGGRLKQIQALNDFLIEQLRRGGTGALLIDEAQHLSEHVLENLRLLSNLETGTEKLLQIVLVGQPELDVKLAQPSLRQLKQRISVQCRIDRLKDREIQPYIQFRLESVGASRTDLFGRAAIQQIAHYSNGIPRLINIICDNALTIAFATSQRTVSPEIIEEVAGDLRLRDEAVPAGPARTPEPASRPAPVVAREDATPAPVAWPVQAGRDETDASARPAAPQPARRERREPRDRRAIWTGAGIAAALVVGAGAVLSAPHLAELGSGIRAAASSVTEATASSVAHAWQGMTAQVASIARPSGADDTSRPLAGAERAAPHLQAAERAAARPPAPVSTPAAPVGPPPAPAPAPAVVAQPPATARVPERTTVPPAPVAPVTPRPVPVAPAAMPPAPSEAAASATGRSEPPIQTAAVTASRPRTSDLAPTAPARAGEQRPMLIPQGGTISDIAFRTYGHYSTLAVDLIKEHNPHIADLDWIRAGDRLWLPPLTRDTLIRTQADGTYRLVLASFLSPAAAEKLGDGVRRRGYDARVLARPVTGQLSLYRVEVVGLTTRDAAEGAWRTALANCWVITADAPCERTNP